jgi:hypothetical protein
VRYIGVQVIEIWGVVVLNASVFNTDLGCKVGGEV